MMISPNISGVDHQCSNEHFLEHEMAGAGHFPPSNVIPLPMSVHIFTLRQCFSQRIERILEMHGTCALAQHGMP